MDSDKVRQCGHKISHPNPGSNSFGANSPPGDDEGHVGVIGPWVPM